MGNQRYPAPSAYGDQLRAQAAAMACTADVTDMTRLLDSTTALGLDVAEFRAQVLRSARYIRQVGSIQAAKALAYDEFIAAGGRDNPDAYAAYTEATERNTALLPGDDLSDWTPPPVPPIVIRDAPDEDSTG